MKIEELPEDLRSDFEGDDNESNWDALQDMVKESRDRGLIPFVGAGMSAPFGLMTWRKFLEKQAGEVRLTAIPTINGQKRIAVKTALDKGMYEEVALAIKQLSDKFFNDEVRRVYGADKINRLRDWEADRGYRPNDSALPTAFLLPYLSSGSVITTNFDSILEKIFNVAQKPFSEVVSGTARDTALRNIGTNAHVLLKLHGDTTPDSGRVFTRSEYDDIYGDNPSSPDFNKPLPDVLSVLAKAHSFLFLGASLKQDRTMPVLKMAMARLDTSHHFALMARPADKDEIRKERLHLSKHAIRPIYYANKDGKHVLLRLLLEFVIRQLGTFPSINGSGSTVGGGGGSGYGSGGAASVTGNSGSIGTNEVIKIATFLEGLMPDDFARIFYWLPNISPHLPDNGTHIQRVAALIRYVNSSTGPGMSELIRIGRVIWGDKFPN